MRLPLVTVDDATWTHLRRLAYACAAYGNALLSASYVEAKGLGDVAGMQRAAYKTASDVLSAAIRDAVGRECVGLWRRLGKKILRGEQTLARFAADRALVVRDRGVRLTREGGGHWLHLRLVPKAQGPLTRLALWEPALRKDAGLARLVERLWSGDWPVTKATVQFERPGRKVYVRLSYRRPVEAVEPGEGLATLTWTAGVEGASRAGELWLRANGRALSLNDHIHRLVTMKQHFAGIHHRLRRDLGKRGRRQDHRAALVKAGSFEAWASGPLHQLSRAVVAWCQQQRVATLEVRLPTKPGVAGIVPWARLALLLAYKSEEAGLACAHIQPSDEPSEALRNEAPAAGAQPPARQEESGPLQRPDFSGGD